MLGLAAPTTAQQVAADSQGTCAVSIDYAVSLGEGGGDNSNVPIFVASLGITNHANEQTLQFLGTKAAVGVDPANPYKVAPVSNLLFNNFVCEAYGSSNASINGSTAEQTDYEAFVGTAAPTSTIYLEYTPITYVNLPVNLNPFTQFLVRLTNIGNTSLVLDDVTLDYWFNGPADSSVSVDQFRPVCSDTTIGAVLEAAPGLAPAPAPIRPLQLTEMEVLFSVSSTQFLVPINSTLDYSYLNTSTNGLPTNTSDNQTYIIPRTALPNSKITAYLNGTLVWGSQPVLVSCCPVMTCSVHLPAFGQSVIHA
ncbi:hypothetical protein WJX79_010055 [Trebouxia sp. C0005]